MKFPGEDYLVYAQDPVRSDADSYAESGLHRFLFSVGADPRMIREDVLALREAFERRGLDYEMVFTATRPGNRIVVTGGKAHAEQVPVWRTGEPIADLRKIATDHELVYVHNTIEKHRVEHEFAMRELFELLLDPPPGRIVVFGHLQRALFYAWGAAGSAVRIRAKKRREIERVLDARSRYWEVRSIDDVQKVPGLEDPGIDRSQVARAMMDFIQQIPIEFKAAYENFERPKNQWAYGKAANGSRKGVPISDLLFSVSGTQIRFTVGDRRLCDFCSVKYACKLYRERSVCIMPGTDGRRFADYFATRDAEDVLNGVGAALQMQATRLESMLEDEFKAAKEAEDNGERVERDPEINKVLNDVQRNAASYAKLLNPMLTRPQVAVQVNTNSGSVETLRHSEITPRQRAAAARELEAAGTPRGSLTPEMILEHIAQKEGKVIEGEVIDGVRNDF